MNRTRSGPWPRCAGLRLAILGIVLMAGTVACRRQPADTSPAMAGATHPTGILRSTVPPGTDGNAIYDREDATRQIEAFIRQNPGGIADGLRGTYGQMVPGADSTFFLPRGEPFRGEFFLHSGREHAHGYGLLCLLDYLQVPCSPGADHFQSHEGVAFGDAVMVPITVTVTGKGLHDLLVMFQEDPFLPGPAGYDSFQDRTLPNVRFARASLSVEGSVAAPEGAYIQGDRRPADDGRLPGFVPSDLAEPRGAGPTRSWIIWTETRAPAGGMLDFYLHVGREEEHRYGVVAFVDFEQVPIHHGGEVHTPLYVHSPAGEWRSMPVSIPVPAEPGEYELRILTVGEPFARLDTLTLAEQDALSPYPHSSARVLLRVE